MNRGALCAQTFAQPAKVPKGSATSLESYPLLSKIEDIGTDVTSDFFFSFYILSFTRKKKNEKRPQVRVVVKECLKGICPHSPQSEDMSKLCCFTYKTYMQKSLHT